jgi:signal transduction histidine kinase
MFDYNEDEDWDSLAGDIKINVYRIIQETFQNAIKHSKCSTFIVAFDRTDTHFNVIMKDNGIGFNFDKGRNGIGIRNISSRIKKLSGKWHLDSKVGQGTTTSLKIPLYKNPTNSAHTKQLLENV